MEKNNETNQINLLKKSLDKSKKSFFQSDKCRKLSEKEINHIFNEYHLKDYVKYILQKYECYIEFNYTNWVILENGNVLLLFPEIPVTYSNGLTTYHDKFLLIEDPSILNSSNILENKSLFRKSYSLLVDKIYQRYVSVPKDNINEVKIFLDQLSNYMKKFSKNIQKIEALESSIIKNQQDSKKNTILNSFDSDNNGLVDSIEGDDEFKKIFKKYQKKIIEIDRSYVKDFVKISNFLKTKRENIQNIFSEIKSYDFSTGPLSLLQRTRKLQENTGKSLIECKQIVEGENYLYLNFDEMTDFLKEQIQFYNLIVIHSINMIVSLSEDDMITFYEIYESFDKLKVFKSDHEVEVSKKLSEIGYNLGNLISSINKMEKNILNGLNNISYDISIFSNKVSSELKSINSSLDFNNLISGVQTYQLYKINKQTKGLIE